MGAMSDDRPGFHLPLLLAGTFRVLIDSLHAELAKHGHDEARPLHGFALQAIGPDGANISELGRRLGVSKQAAGKTATGLEHAGYVRRQIDPRDRRAWILVRTERGNEMLTLSARFFQQIATDWANQIGNRRLQALEDDLQQIIDRDGGLKVGDLPGWLR